jgi:hypothetical protein
LQKIFIYNTFFQQSYIPLKYSDSERKRGKLPLAEQLAQSLGDRLKQMGKSMIFQNFFFYLNKARFYFLFQLKIIFYIIVDGGPLANAKRDSERCKFFLK